MAIPLSMPNSEDVDDGHRLDLLLEQLLITLRQVLVHRRRVAAAAVSRTSSTASHVRNRYETVDQTTRTNLEHRTNETVEETRVLPTEEVEEGEMTTTGSTTTTTSSSSVVQFPLPDLVLDSSTSGKDTVRIMRNCHVDHRIHCCQRCQHHRQLHAGSPTSWITEGGQLIRLAGEILEQVRSTAKEP